MVIFYNMYMKLHKLQIYNQKYDFTLYVNNSKVQMMVHFIQTISAGMSKHVTCANNSVNKLIPYKTPTCLTVIDIVKEVVTMVLHV